MSLDIRYYNPYVKRYSIGSTVDDGNEEYDGTIYRNRNEISIGNGSGTEINSKYAFFRFEIPEVDAVDLENKKVLPDTSLVLPVSEYFDFPWSGRMYCELTPSSVPLGTVASGISSRTKTSAYFDIDHTDFEPVRHVYNDEVYGYWSMDEASGVRKDGVRWNTSHHDLYSSGFVGSVPGSRNNAAHISGGSLHAYLSDVGLPTYDHGISFDFVPMPSSENVFSKILSIRKPTRC